MGSQRIFRTRRDVLRPVGVALEHVGGWPPVGADALADHAGPAQSRQFRRLWHAGRENTVNRLVLGPIVQRAALGIDKDRAVAGVCEVRLP